MNIELINKIAKKICARSQMVKTCKIDQDNNLSAHIEEQIFLQSNNYFYSDLQKDIDGFIYDVNNELGHINFTSCNKDDIKLKIDDNKLLKFSYDFKGIISDEQKELIKSYEWIVDEGE